MSGHPAVPSSSIWPVTLAVGAGLAAVGLLTNWVVLLAGVAILALGIVGWIAESLEQAG